MAYRIVSQRVADLSPRADQSIVRAPLLQAHPGRAGLCWACLGPGRAGPGKQADLKAKLTAGYVLRSD